MKTVTFYYVRHGETEYNRDMRMQGWCDSPLTPRGLAEAKEARRRLEQVPLTTAWCSPSPRCRTTADIVLRGRNIPLRMEEGLREMHYGSDEGVYFLADPGLLQRMQTPELDWTPYGGESLALLKKRAASTFERIFQASQDQDHVLIVSHGIFALAMVSVFFDIPWADLMGEKDPVPHGYTLSFVRREDRYFLQEDIGGQIRSLLKKK
jgi:broad specificity phosphatase PhoE